MTVYDNPGLENEEQTVTTIEVTPSNKPYNNLSFRPSNNVNEALQDEISNSIPPRQTDTQLKMKKLGMTSSNLLSL